MYPAIAVLIAVIVLAALALLVTGLRFLYAPAAVVTIVWVAGFFIHGPSPAGRWYRW